MIFATLNNLGILHCNYVYIDNFKLFLRLIFGLHLQQVVKHFFFSSLIRTLGLCIQFNWQILSILIIELSQRQHSALYCCNSNETTTYFYMAWSNTFHIFLSVPILYYNIYIYCRLSHCVFLKKSKTRRHIAALSDISRGVRCLTPSPLPFYHL